ncbi:MAG: MerR family transcriptional regulator, partial [Candidatus Eisenbacteria bacterium]|nr:MerR family transcriptional regulator [Candidatus Eisenbacteria bacterium]
MAEEQNVSEPIKKLYYSISEVSDMLGVKPHVLRYWESQFGALRPKKSRAGNRMYRERDVEVLRLIQDLLHVRRFTIAGARREIGRLRNAGTSFPPAEMPEGSESTDAPVVPEVPANPVPSLSRASTHTEERAGAPDRGALPPATHPAPVAD